jgi:phosphatidylserine decarboxylase
VHVTVSYTAKEIQCLPSNNNALNFAALVCHLLPKNLISFCVGALFRVKWPGPLEGLVVRGFARFFKIDMSEAEHPISHYKTIEDLFTRALKKGARPVASGRVVSPADGCLSRSLPITAGMALQVKGIEYSVDELVTGSTKETGIDWDWFQTVYLAPHNYHRVHAPCDGKLLSIKHIPGQLWPVNVPFVLRIFKLFNRNERLVFECEVNGGRAWVVMVGALNVGRMVTPFWPDFVTNSFEQQFDADISVKTFEEPIAIRKGDELGTFMLGSTVVIAYDKPSLSGESFQKYYGDKPVRMGGSLEEL